MTIIAGQARKKKKANQNHGLELTILKVSVLVFFVFVFLFLTCFSVLCGNIITVALVPDFLILIFNILIILRKETHIPL